MRDVNYGWLIRYAHSNGASFFFICVYIHIARGLYYGSYNKPRIGLWYVGVIIYFIMMGTAFMGYVYSLKWYNFLSNLLLNYFFEYRISSFPAFYIVTPILNIFPKIHINKWRKGDLVTVPDRSTSNKKNEKKNEIPIAEKIYKNLHLIETQLQIKNDNRNKAAIYCILNYRTGEKYIGSASTNRINTRFRNHCLHGTGNRNLKKYIDKYGLDKFYFLILEYYSGLVLKENLKKSHLSLLALETNYLNRYLPEYNILKEATSSLGYKHSEETKKKMKENYSEERKIRIGNLNKNKIYTYIERFILSKAAYERYLTQPNLRKILAAKASKPVILYLKDEKTIHSKYSSVRNMAKVFNCCHKTINKSIKNHTLFKNIGYIKYDNKTN